MSEQPLYFTKTLVNGLKIEVRDLTRRYYGDYHKVQLEVAFRLPLDAHLIDGQTAPSDGLLERARRSLGDEAVSVRRLERMAVPSDLVDETRACLWESFSGSSMAYLQHPDYPAGMIRRLLEQKNTPRPNLRNVR